MGSYKAGGKILIPLGRTDNEAVGAFLHEMSHHVTSAEYTKLTQVAVKMNDRALAEYIVTVNESKAVVAEFTAIPPVPDGKHRYGYLTSAEVESILKDVDARHTDKQSLDYKRDILLTTVDKMQASGFVKNKIRELVADYFLGKGLSITKKLTQDVVLIIDGFEEVRGLELTPSVFEIPDGVPVSINGSGPYKRVEIWVDGQKQVDEHVRLPETPNPGLPPELSDYMIEATQYTVEYGSAWYGGGGGVGGGWLEHYEANRSAPQPQPQDGTLVQASIDQPVPLIEAAEPGPAQALGHGPNRTASVPHIVGSLIQAMASFHSAASESANEYLPNQSMRHFGAGLLVENSL